MYPAGLRRLLPLAALPLLLGCGDDDPTLVLEDPPTRPDPTEAVHGPPTAFVGVTVLPMTGAGELPDRTVVVRDGRIVEVGPASAVPVPDDAVVVDGKGRWLVPGLADMHTHLGTNYSEFTNRRPPADELQAMAEGQMLLYLANGVTTILNNGGFGEPVLRWRDEVLEGRYPGPTIYAAKYARGPVGTPDGGPPSRSVRDAAEARAFARKAVEEGWHFVKVYNWTPRDAVLELLEAGEAWRLPVVGHLPLTMPAEEALDRGLAMVAHADAFHWSHFRHVVSPSRIPEVVAMTRSAGAAVTGTLDIRRTVTAIWGGDETAIAEFWSRPETRYMHWTEEALHREGIRGPRWNPDGARPGELDDDLAFVLSYTRALHDAGVPLLAGTDSPTVLGVAGFSLHRELDALSGLGLTPLQVLETATRGPGAFIESHLGPDERFGTVEPGARADLLLLASDPSVDLGALEDRVAVMARGVLHTEEELEAGLEALAARYR